MTLTPGTLGIDYSGARPEPADIARNGGQFIVRYSAGAGNTAPNTQWKLCGPGEIAAAVAAGLDVIANSEWYETRVTEGAAAGKVDGTADLAFWRSRGYARGAVILVSWDAAPIRAQWAAVDAYLAAYRDALGGYYTLGAYAGTPYLRHALDAGLITVGWRPNAGSWSGDGLPYQPGNHGRDLLAQALAATPAHIWQTGNYWYGKGADENVIVRAGVPSHRAASGAPAPDATAPRPAPAPVAPKPAPAPAPAPKPAGRSYTVRAGDTLSGIAARFRTTWQKLAARNRLANPNRIYPGQVLRVDDTTPVPAPAAAPQVYVVRPGDTLSAIAAAHGTSWQRLQQLNGIADPNRIYVGQRLRVR